MTDQPPLEATAVDLSVTLGRLSLKNPILVASGTFGYAREMLPFVNLADLGGIVPKTVTDQPRAGNPTPRIVETASGMLNAIGLDNDGLDYFLANHLPWLRTVGTSIFVNIAGEDRGNGGEGWKRARSGGSGIERFLP